MKLNESLLRRMRHVAVDEHLSVSAWVASLIEQTLRKKDTHSQARDHALRVLETGLKLGGKPLKRNDLHER